MKNLPLFLLLLCPTLAVANDPIAGTWRGSWQSDKTGHHGPMRAFVRPAGDGYNVLFVGRFAKVIPFAYRSHLSTTEITDNGVSLTAEKRLPPFGTFRTNATATANVFEARYNAKVDHGTFRFSR
jgi:hypothetical protein